MRRAPPEIHPLTERREACQGTSRRYSASMIQNSAIPATARGGCGEDLWRVERALGRQDDAAEAVVGGDEFADDGADEGEGDPDLHACEHRREGAGEADVGEDAESGCLLGAGEVEHLGRDDGRLTNVEAVASC